MTNAEAWFNIALRPRKPEGSLGRTAQDGHLDSHTTPELCGDSVAIGIYIYNLHPTHPHPSIRPKLISLMVYVGVKHHERSFETSQRLPCLSLSSLRDPAK